MKNIIILLTGLLFTIPAFGMDNFLQILNAADNASHGYPEGTVGMRTLLVDDMIAGRLAMGDNGSCYFGGPGGRWMTINLAGSNNSGVRFHFISTDTVNGRDYQWQDKNMIVAGMDDVSNAVSSAQSYTAGTPANWSGGPPSTVGAALDRMAALLVTLNGGNPIP